MASRSHNGTVPPKISIRRATGKDAREAAGLLTAQLRELEVATPVREIASAVKGMIAAPSRGFILLASLGGKPIGVAYVAFTWTLEHGGRCAWLEELFVLPEHRERGIGRQLLLEAMKIARRLGCRAMDLELENMHPRAGSLYDRENFERLNRSRMSIKLTSRPPSTRSLNSSP